MNCSRCGKRHVGVLIYAAPGWMFEFQQDFEQWCDMHLDDWEIAKIRSSPIVKIPGSPLQSFLAMANAPTF